MTTTRQEAQEQTDQSGNWIKRMGTAGFAFFFIKGMLWLIIPALAHSALFN
jgi:hypothetical protein